MPTWLIILNTAVSAYFVLNAVIAVAYSLAVLSGPPPDEAKFVRRDIRRMFFFGLPWIMWLAMKDATHPLRARWRRGPIQTRPHPER
ncbi:MAG: hypothetical protein AAB650_00155 [Patescibacteria group bacterium]